MLHPTEGQKILEVASILCYNKYNIEYRRKVGRTGAGKQFERCSLRFFFSLLSSKRAGSNDCVQLHPPAGSSRRKDFPMNEQNATNEPMNNQTAEQNLEKDAACQEKKFTQADVDRIVKERLRRRDEAKEKAQNEQFAAMQAEVTKRENRLACREYLLDKRYPAGLLEIIDTTDPNEFKAKADKAFSLFGPQRHFTPPLRSTEPEGGYFDTAEHSAFTSAKKHKPKTFPPLYDEE